MKSIYEEAQTRTLFASSLVAARILHRFIPSCYYFLKFPEVLSSGTSFNGEAHRNKPAYLYIYTGTRWLLLIGYKANLLHGIILILEVFAVSLVSFTLSKVLLKVAF